ncbi:putative ribonuclease H-like domain-containing protein [Tanacetum coccineum]
MTKNVTEHVEPKKVIQALQDPSWIEAMQEELLQFKLQQVWTLMDLPHGKRAIGTKWVYMNKKIERGIVIRNKARIKAIRLFLAYALFKDFVVYQMDVKSAFLYGKIEEEVYVCQPTGFEDPEFPNKVYKDSPFDLEADTHSDYASASLDKKSTTGGCQFIGSRLISWQYRSKLLVATLLLKLEYVAVASCCGKDSNEKKLIQMIKIHTDQNVADLLTKAFDFWQTATARTLDNGEMEITATIDGKVKIVSEASIRRHLNLEYSDGPVFMGEGSNTIVESITPPYQWLPPTSQPPISSTSRRLTRQESVVPQPRSPTQTNVADEVASTCVDVRLRGATTTITGLEAGQDLKQTKQIYGTAFTKLIKKVKKLEKTVKTSQARRKANLLYLMMKKIWGFPKGRKEVKIDKI